MWHTRTQRFTYYVILSTLLHVLCLAGVLGYFRLLPHTLPLPEAVRITLAAPALPAEPRLAPGTPLSHVLPTPPPSVPLTMDASPSLTVVDLPAPQPISAPPLPPQPPTVDRPRAIETPAVAVRMPEPPVSAPPQPQTPLAGEPTTLPQTMAPAPDKATATAALLPPVMPLAPLPSQQPRDERLAQERVAVPRPHATQLPRRTRPAPQTQPSPPVAPPAPKTSPQAPEILTTVQASPQAIPVSPPATPVVRRDTTPTSLAAPPAPPTKPLPPVSPTPAPTPPMATTPPHIGLPPTATTRETALPASPPPPSLEATLPGSRLPMPPVGSGQPQDVVTAPQVARRTPAVEPSPFETLPNFVYQPKPVYPLIAKRRGWEGTVTLEIELRADGSVGAITVAQSSGYPLLDEAAMDKVKTWRHIPVKRDGIPITRQAHLPLVFKLD